MESPSASMPPERMLTRSVAPATRSRMKMSTKPLVSPATRLVETLAKTT
jgi:hypothetical protein